MSAELKFEEPIIVQSTGLAKFNVTKEEITTLQATYKALTIAGIEDKAGIKAVDEARKDVKKKRVEIDKTRKSLNEKAQEYIKNNNSAAKEYIDILEGVEIDCESKLQAIEDEKERIAKEKAAAEQKRIADRVKSLIDNGCSFDGVNYAIGENLSISQPTLLICSDEIFNQFLDKVKVQNEIEVAAKIEADRVAKDLADKIEADRLAEIEAQKVIAENNRKESERLENLRKEQEAKQAEIERKENEIKMFEAKKSKEMFDFRISQLAAIGMNNYGNDYYFSNQFGKVEITETEIMELVLDAFAETVSEFKAKISELKEKEAIEGERIADEQEAKRLQELEDAKQQAIQQEKDRQAKEIADGIEAEKARQAEATRQAALAPDKDKLLTLSDAISKLSMPELSTDAAKAMLVNIKDLLTKTQMYITKQVKSL